MKALPRGGKQTKLGIRVLNSRPRNKINCGARTSLI